MSELFAMGGYAAFVWTAYGVAAAVLLVLLIATIRSLKTRQATLAALEALRGARRIADQGTGPAEHGRTQE